MNILSGWITPLKIHSVMGDTYNRMEVLVSNIEKLFSLWDRGQFIDILLRTRIMKNMFLFVQRMKQFMD